MIYDGIKLIEGSALENLVISTGTSFPSSPDEGELFVRTDAGNAGLYIYQNAAWSRLVKDGEVAGGATAVGASGTIQLSNGAGALTTLDNFRWNTSAKALLVDSAFSVYPADLPVGNGGVTGRSLAIKGGTGGNGSTGGLGGALQLYGGSGGTGTTSNAGSGGALQLYGGNAGTDGNWPGNGGWVQLYGGQPHGSGTPGSVAIYTNGTERLRISNTGAFGLSGANYGSTGQVLTSQGSGLAPVWTTPDSFVSNSLVTLDTNQTITGNKTISNATTIFTRSDNGPAFTRFESSSNTQYFAGGISVGMSNATLTSARYTQIYQYNALANGASTGFAIAQADSNNAFVRSIFNYNYTDQRLQLSTNGSVGLAIDSTQRVLLGTSSSIADYVPWHSRLQIAGGSNGDARILAAAYTNDPSAAGLVFMKSRSTTVGSGFTAVQANDNTGSIVFSATNGSAIVRSAAINGFAETVGSVGSGVPGYLSFYTAAASTPNSLSERMRINSTGQVMVGMTAPVTQANSSQAGFSVGSTEVGQSRMAVSIFRNDANSAGLTFTKSRGATAGTHGLVQNGDGLGFMPFEGSTGSAYARGAIISVVVDGTPSSTSMPAKISFYTTPQGSLVPVERFTLTSAGAWSVNSSTGTAGQVLVSNGSASSPTWQDIPNPTKLERVTTFDANARGKRVALSAGITIPAGTYAPGDAFSFYNTTGSAITISQGSSLTLRQDGTPNTGTRTLAAYGTCFVWFNTTNEAIISGSIS